MPSSEEDQNPSRNMSLKPLGHRGRSIQGVAPTTLFDKPVRDRITTSIYWMECCSRLNAATLCDQAANLTYIGGTYGITGKPTPFLCLAFRLLELAPEKDIILEYLNFKEDLKDKNGKTEEVSNDNDGKANEVTKEKPIEFKYLRCLAAFYIRLTWKPVEIYQHLEPLLKDFRKIRKRTKDGFTLTYVDEFVDDLLTKNHVCGTTLWRLKPRQELEDMDLLEPREKLLPDEDEDDEEMVTSDAGASRSPVEMDVGDWTIQREDRRPLSSPISSSA
ncbi:PRP38-domain-containing protein [Westerdykella ornata]|uniref:Pre-mRNA-splicing factor 38 n=1 Tax=Westerdykella ornata TaxID=318751 RepID=A0A6A6JMY6_WESOR|nr:PRP38-domain-containing protein [Westerdykella ornata]KAF2277961.1 PRP38-domain-containing protein [Westerdykella ornata]